VVIQAWQCTGVELRADVARTGACFWWMDCAFLINRNDQTSFWRRCRGGIFNFYCLINFGFVLVFFF